jgi:hypothetical protein
MERSLIEAFGYGSNDEYMKSNEKMDVDDIPSSQDYIPLTKIIFITTHGDIITQQNKDNLSEPKLVRVPDNMEVIKITVTAPGVTNIADENDIISYHNSILKVLEQLRNPNTSILELQHILNELIKEFQKAFQEQLKIKNTQIFDRSADTDFYLRDFKRHSNKAFQVYYLEPGSFIVDKEYSRTEDDYKTDLDFRILSLPDTDDLLRGDNTEITTGEVMNYFSENGATRLIIFDLSCSTCSNMNERATRRLRRTITRSHAYGGKRKQTRRRRKQNKQKTKKSRATRKK